jgi:acyl-coenzyme A synthetase/AMP-(fatty) acid ligase
MLAQGVRLIVWRQFERAKLFEMIHKYNVTVLSVVPVILEAMANVDVQLEETLRYIFVGGDRLAAEVVHKMEKRLAPEQHIVQCKQSFC